MKIIKLILYCLCFFIACGPESFKGTELPEMPFTDFTLSDQHGNSFTLSENKGKIIMLFFGFTFCPDVCPLTLSTWKRVQDQLSSEEQERTEFVYITVDPDRDTPEKLKAHLKIFSEKFLGLTGSTEQLDQVYRGYGVYREKVIISESAAGYLMNHTGYIYILNKESIWQLKHSNDAPPEDIAHDIRLLLSQKN